MSAHFQQQPNYSIVIYLIYLCLASVAIAIDAILSDKSLREKEQLIISQFEALPAQSVLRLMRELQERYAGLQLVSMCASRSVRLYFLCPSLEALELLRDLLDSGRLKFIVEELFGLLLTGTQFGSVSVKLLYLIEYCTSAEYLSNPPGKPFTYLSESSLHSW